MWLLETSVLQEMDRIHKAGYTPSSEQQARFEARFDSDDDNGNSRILTIAGANAEISIKGVITKTPSLMAMIFGGGNTTYSE